MKTLLILAVVLCAFSVEAKNIRPGDGDCKKIAHMGNKPNDRDDCVDSAMARKPVKPCPEGYSIGISGSCVKWEEK